MLITTVSLSEHHRQGSKCEIKFNNALITTCTCLWWQQLWQTWLKMGRRQKCHSSVKVEISGGGGGSRGTRQGWRLSKGRSQPRVSRVCPGVRARGTGGGLATTAHSWASGMHLNWIIKGFSCLPAIYICIYAIHTYRGLHGSCCEAMTEDDQAWNLPGSKSSSSKLTSHPFLKTLLF